MSIRSEGLALAAAVSPRVQVVATTGSTNADVVAHVRHDPAGWPHLSVLLTDDQRRGRGRLDRAWTAPPGTALAASVVVRVGSLPPSARGWIPLVAGAAMTRAIASQLAGSSHLAALKWPNDVLVDGRKICGVLAEVVPGDPDAVVVGAGVNTRMDPAELPVETATSFAAIGASCDEDRVLADWLTGLDAALVALAAAGGDPDASGVREGVASLCATIGSAVRVSLPDGTTLEGTATAVDALGRLEVVGIGGRTSAVSAGDVVHVR